MKTILTAVLLVTATWAQANLSLTQTFTISNPSVNGAIPDGDPVGVLFHGAYNQAGAGNQVLGVSVGLNISGGYNGDLYAYLVAPNGTLVVLMNQPGSSIFGAGGAGMNITLQDGTTANGSIQSAGDGILTGSYNPASILSAFDGSPADGTWQLFFADMNSGGGTAQMNSWSLDITVVPEPVALSLLILLGMIAALAGLKWAWRT